VLAPLPGDVALVRHGITAEPFDVIAAAWRDASDQTLRRLGLPTLPATVDPLTARTGHSDAFRALHTEFTMVRRSEAGATW
jgi:hypothetical protein